MGRNVGDALFENKEWWCKTYLYRHKYMCYYTNRQPVGKG